MQHITYTSTSSLGDALTRHPSRKKRKITKKHKRAPAETIKNTFKTAIVQGERASSRSIKESTHHSHRKGHRKYSKNRNREAARALVVEHKKSAAPALSNPESPVIQAPIPKQEKKRGWQLLKCVAQEAYKAITYNGQKDESLKPKHVATRVAAVALPFLQYIIPQTQIVTGVFKACYQVAEMCGKVDKTKQAKKKTLKGAIESPLTKSILGVAAVVAAFFSSRVAIVVCSAIKIGLDIIDLRNSIVSDGFTKDSTLILIKLAGSVAYLALALFDSNIALIFSISAKLANNLFTAYCEASQGRYVEAIAALAFGCLSNYSNMQSISTSINDNTLLKSGTVTLSAEDMAGVTNMNPTDISPSEKEAAEKKRTISPAPTIKVKDKSIDSDEQEKKILRRRRLRAKCAAEKEEQEISTPKEALPKLVIPLFIDFLKT